MTYPDFNNIFAPEYDEYSIRLEELIIPKWINQFEPDNSIEFNCRTILSPAPELGSKLWTQNGKRIKIGVFRIFNKLEFLSDLNGNLTTSGELAAVALEGNTLWYADIPSIPDVLTVIYYALPDLLVNDNDIPRYIPDFLHRQILVNGAAAIAWDYIEGGVEGLKVNARSRLLSMESGVVKFREWLGKNRKHYISTEGDNSIGFNVLVHGVPFWRYL